MNEDKIICDCCGEPIVWHYQDNHNGTYTCISCLNKLDDGYIIDNEMGCDW